MDLFEEDLLDEKKKVKKMGTGIIVAIIISIILIVVILVIISYLQSMQLGMFINGVQSPLSSTTVIQEESGKMYISIKDLSKALGYTYYNGEYGAASEDNKKGFVETDTDEEVASFEMNSKKIYKILLNDNAKNNEYDYIYIDEPIRYINGNLYATVDGIKKIYNADITYNQETNKINIYTLSYLTQYYTTNIASMGYAQIDENFYNLKAIINGMLVVENNSGRLGVIDLTTNKEIIGTKYSGITYIEATNEFLVENNEKVGIVNNLGRTKIALEYDELKLLDNDSGLYIAKLGDKYGVINKQGSIIIHIEYDEIGVDKTLFKSSEVSNPYLLYDNCIPVCRNDKWGIYNISGRLIVPIEYDVMGCIVSSNKNNTANNALLLEDYEAIILGRNAEENNESRKFYAVVNSRGEFIVQLNSRVESIYYITENGEDIYQIEINGAKGNLDDVFSRSGIKKVNRSVESTDNSEDIDINQNVVTDGQTNQNTGENESDNQNSTEQQNSSEEQASQSGDQENSQ